MSRKGYSDARVGDRAGQLAALVGYRLRGPATFARVKARSFQRARAALEAHRGSARGPGRLVDVGAGQWLANAKGFAALGWNVLAVDPEIPPQSLVDVPPFVKAVGLQRALKTAVGEVLLRRSFDAEFHAHTGLRIAHARVEVARTGSESLPLQPGSIDVVISDNVFEHLKDVVGVIEELARVLKPGALAFITIHPFTALSGGHHPSTFHHGSQDRFVPAIPPWDHLREHRHPSGVYLNRWRAPRFRAAFEPHFETLTWESLREGEALLTPALEAELGDYSRDELLTGKIVFVGRRRSAV